jgi:hypothetical protein
VTDRARSRWGPLAQRLREPRRSGVTMRASAARTASGEAPPSGDYGAGGRGVRATEFGQKVEVGQALLRGDPVAPAVRSSSRAAGPDPLLACAAQRLAGAQLEVHGTPSLPTPTVLKQQHSTSRSPSLWLNLGSHGSSAGGADRGAARRGDARGWLTTSTTATTCRRFARETSRQLRSVPPPAPGERAVRRTQRHD